MAANNGIKFIVKSIQLKEKPTVSPFFCTFHPKFTIRGRVLRMIIVSLRNPNSYYDLHPRDYENV